MTISSLVSKVLLLLSIFILFSCSNKESVIEKEETKEVTYFEKVFKDTSNLFNGLTLGDQSTNQIEEFNLGVNDHCTIIYQTINHRLVSIKLECDIENNEIRNQLAQEILSLYNLKLNKEKSNQQFSSWSYKDENNKPVEILLITDQPSKLLTLSISYRNQL